MLTVEQLAPAAFRWLYRLILFAALCFSLLLAWADYLFQSGTPENIRRAAQLAPFNALYQARSGNLARAVELNPYFSSAWRELAEQAERENRLEEAERCFLRATEVDKQFAARWAAANFYFRRNRWKEFDHWMALAAEHSYGDRTAMFRLAHAGEGRRPVLNLWPADREVLANYVLFLVVSKEWAEVPAAAKAWMAVAGSKDRDRVIDICEQIISAGQIQQARYVWQAAVDKILPEYRSDNAGNLLTNAGLQVRPLGKGFDWKPLWRQGLQSSWFAGQLRLDLDGRQFDRTEMLEQTVAVEPGPYRLRWGSRAEGIRNGVRFRVFAVGGAELGTVDHEVASGGGTLAFVVPKGVAGIRLVLSYERKPGTVRQEGSLLLDGNLRLWSGVE